MAFAVLGKPQIVRHIGKDDTILHDPLRVTVLDFNRRALDELEHALHLTVKHTYSRARGIHKHDFFKGRDDKVVDPSKDPSGRDVFYLLKNIEYHIDLYAKLLRKKRKRKKNAVETTVGFLLETVRNGMAHQTYLGCTGDPELSNSCSCELKKNKTALKCLKDCKKLMTWILRAPFYKAIGKNIKKIRENINNITDSVFKDFEKVEEAAKHAANYDPHYALNTEEILQKLDKLREAVALEMTGNFDDSIHNRPLTLFLKMVVFPRLSEIQD